MSRVQGTLLKTPSAHSLLSLLNDSAMHAGSATHSPASRKGSDHSPLGSGKRRVNLLGFRV